MIPATSFQPSDDGTEAWGVDQTPADSFPASWDQADKPCGTCEGTTIVDNVVNGPGDVTLRRCPDCDRTGRHTFTIEVGDHWGLEGRQCPSCIRTYRVHVLDVLPIHDWCPDENPARHICNAYQDERWVMHLELDNRIVPSEQPVTLPPDAAPGKWAVRLAVHQ